MMRLKQFSISMLVVLALFASVAAICACSHHQVQTEPEVLSCHQTSAPTEKVSDGGDRKEALNFPCECFGESVPKVFAKSPTVKIEKQAAKQATVTPLEFDVVSDIASVVRHDFVKPFYLSDSFYKSKSPRAPPVV